MILTLVGLDEKHTTLAWVITIFKQVHPIVTKWVFNNGHLASCMTMTLTLVDQIHTTWQGYAIFKQVHPIVTKCPRYVSIPQI